MVSLAVTIEMVYAIAAAVSIIENAFFLVEFLLAVGVVAMVCGAIFRR
jgi:hypothetical protein